MIIYVINIVRFYFKELVQNLIVYISHFPGLHRLESTHHYAIFLSLVHIPLNTFKRLIFN